jgi:hypothetical protein
MTRRIAIETMQNEKTMRNKVMAIRSCNNNNARQKNHKE